MFPFPKDFLNSLKSIPHFQEKDFMKVHDERKPPTSIRLNSFKQINTEFKLNNKVPWTQSGFYLEERPVFTADPLFHSGCYYVQEASSMFVEFVLRQLINFDQELSALDLCAAPGGKTTILSSLLNAESLLIANEVMKNRADVLSYNIAKWGNCNHVVTSNETTSFSNINSLFDIVLVDAPCSGSGLFRKQPDATNEWSKEAVLQCGNRQKNILKDIVPSLKSDGIMIYSTCSYSIEENEEIVKWLINETGVELVKLTIPKEWGIEDTGFGNRFYPYNLEGEGFFCAAFKKIDGNGLFKMNQKNAFKEATKVEKSIIDQFIKVDFGGKVINHNNEFKLLNNRVLEFINNTKNIFYYKQVGTSLGEIKHEELIPHHFLSLSNHINPEIETVELTINESIKYLKKELFEFDKCTVGLKRITHKGFGIGWAKVLNNRVNNYLPLNWAIFNKEIGLSK